MVRDRDHARTLEQLQCRIVFYEDGSSEFADGEAAAKCLHIDYGK